MEQSGGKCVINFPSGEKGRWFPEYLAEKRAIQEKVKRKGGKRMFLGEFKHNLDAKKRLFIPMKGTMKRKQ